MFKLWVSMLMASAVLIVSAVIIALAVNIYGVTITMSPSSNVHTPRRYGPNFLDVMSSDNTSSLQDHKVNSWPKIFPLSTDPSFPVVCYSGLTLGVSDQTINVTRIPNQEEDISKSSIPKSKSKLFILSADPKFPVICQEGNIPPGLAHDGTVEENITCIRRDYEGDISAIFLQNAGPIETAWNVFNSSIPYGLWNTGNVDSIDDTRVLTEAIVDCNGFTFQIEDKAYVISTDAANSLAGG